MRLFSLGLVCAIAISVHAGDVPINGGDQPIKVHRFAAMSVKVDPNDVVAWAIYPAPLQREDAGIGRLHFAGEPGKTYTVNVTVVNFDLKKLDTGTKEFTWEKLSSPDGGDEDVIPQPPKGLDTTLRAAWELDSSEDQPLAEDLSSFYKEAADKIDAATTWEDLFKAMAVLAQDKKITGKLVVVQRAIAKEIRKVLPYKAADVGKSMGNAGKDKARTLFTSISNSLAKLK